MRSGNNKLATHSYSYNPICLQNLKLIFSQPSKFNVMDIHDRHTKIVYVCHSIYAIMEDGIQKLIYVYFM